MSKQHNAFERPQAKELIARLMEPRQTIQVVAGPRQVGKTTLVRQVAERLQVPNHYSNADGPMLRDSAWLHQQWEVARKLLEVDGFSEAILIIDEVQKIPNWSESIKQLWDEDTANGRAIKVVLLGSAPLLVQKGLTESLMGRFEILRIPHWSYTEMREAFGCSLDQFIYFGSYPGAQHLVDKEERWLAYILDAIIEPTISKDVLLLSRVDKPILLRRLLELSCSYSGQLVSLTKLLGQLHDAGNVTTLAHYLELLEGAGMVCGIQKYSANKLRTRKSIPKFLVFNSALMTVQSHKTFEESREDRTHWGRLTETAIGAHLANAASSRMCELFYWRDRNKEVDFVLRSGDKVIAIEVGTGKKNDYLPGMDAFMKAFKTSRSLLVGKNGIDIEEFLVTPVNHWFK